MTIQEAADSLKISRQTLYRIFHRTGILPVKIIADGRIQSALLPEQVNALRRDIRKTTDNRASV